MCAIMQPAEPWLNHHSMPFMVSLLYRCGLIININFIQKKKINFIQSLATMMTLGYWNYLKPEIGNRKNDYIMHY